VFRIVEWAERYEVSEKGRIPRTEDEYRKGPLKYIRLKVHGHSNGVGFRRLKTIAGNKSMEVFGVFCKLLEIAGNQHRECRGCLLNEKGVPATTKDLAFILDIPLAQVENAISVMMNPDLRWVEQSEQAREIPGEY